MIGLGSTARSPTPGARTPVTTNRARRLDLAMPQLWKLVGVTEAVAAQRLRELVIVGVLEKQPYREPGQRTRFE